MSTPSALSQACIAWPVRASGRPEAKPSTVTATRRCSAVEVEARGGRAASDADRRIRMIGGARCAPCVRRRAGRRASTIAPWPDLRAPRRPSFGADDFRAALGDVRDRRDDRHRARRRRRSRSASPRTRSTRSRSSRRSCSGACRARPARCRRSRAARTTRSTSSPPTSSALAERFASKDVARFDGVAFRAGASGAPLLDGAAAVVRVLQPQPLRGRRPRHLRRRGRALRAPRRRAAADLPRRPLLHRVAAVAHGLQGCSLPAPLPPRGRGRAR